MNEEEKKTVKYFYNLRATIDESNMLFDEEINVKHGKETIKQITIILNLIEKLQKENEELKEIYRSEKKMKNEYIKLYQDLLLKENVISVQKVKDKIEEILNNKEYIIVFEGNAEFPDDATIINAQKYIKLEKMQELIEGNEDKIKCMEYMI